MIKKKLKHDIFTEPLRQEAHAIMGAFSKQAQKEGWTREEINAVLDEAKDGNYDHLIQTLMRHTE